jgi:hypothetical protein
VNSASQLRNLMALDVTGAYLHVQKSKQIIQLLVGKSPIFRRPVAALSPDISAFTSMIHHLLRIIRRSIFRIIRITQFFCCLTIFSLNRIDKPVSIQTATDEVGETMVS